MPSRTMMVLGNRGDPGLFSVLKKIGRVAAGIGSFVTGGLTGVAAAAAGAAVGASGTKTARVVKTSLSNGRVSPRAAGTPQLVKASFVPSFGAAATVGRAIAARVTPATIRGAGKILAGGAIFELGGLLFDAITGEFIEKKKIRRMNVLNPRALSRATRRLSGFNKRSRNVEKQLRRLAPPARRRAHPHLLHHGHHDGHHD